MHELRKLVSSANLLYTFEAAARHANFTLAAKELNVTPAAVSHAIRQLEDGIGLKLFDRQHKRVTVTQEGAKLFQNVSQALDRVLMTTNDLKSEAGKSPVRLYVSITVATHWLLPRLARIREALPLFDLRLYTSDKSLELPDDGMSIAITGGRGTWPGCHVCPSVPPIGIIGATGKFDIHDGPARPAAEVGQEIEGGLRIAGNANRLGGGTD